jgi:hypothetical protein
MTDWERRKRVELTAKLTSLQADIVQWSARSEAGKELEKHHSQVRRLERDFLPVADRLAQEAHDEAIAERWRVVERAAQDLLSVWGYFRDKLAVRLVSNYGRYLAAADDFAWACYQPAQRAAVATGAVEESVVREPPLTCLEDVGSPFSLVRGSPYEGELSASQPLTSSSRALLRRLPVPVIAIPWFQLEHLPDALVIAHEVGHHVLGDIRLEDEIVRTVEGVGNSCRSSWAAEIFCDVFGTVCAGSAFAASLGDFLRVAEIADDATDRYPPTTTRLGLCLAVMELPEIGSTEAARDLRERWAAEGFTIPEVEQATATAVATAVATTRYGQIGVRVVDLEPFTAYEERIKDEESVELLARRETATRDPRVLLAAASAAFALEPEGYRQKQVGESVLDAAHRIREPGVRWRVGHRSTAQPSRAATPERPQASAANDEVEAIYELLMQAAPGSQ